jgi:hypothetical protein
MSRDSISSGILVRPVRIPVETIQKMADLPYVRPRNLPTPRKTERDG